ncbi:hypothetical protein VCRA2122O339_70094 [Vibrio crassostreae]|nr:hypothetical protein VCRA2120E331_140095 [Vibrio crassostreae]CAK3203677.1 hypothetical protein VCRA2127O345_140044 [Vibrio crassostreae]CAK3233599.1 hypothetical protein VCRA2120E330_150094 [Vibrio crassostreae]CAK3240926.1 hypothetical protein VCRA2122O338_140044 [Vibrio crassostreae]CAK3308075.1 hypothetical protein VCRA2122O340_140044 [Vibrio crassostreae]
MLVGGDNQIFVLKYNNIFIVLEKHDYDAAQEIYTQSVCDFYKTKTW